MINPRYFNNYNEKQEKVQFRTSDKVIRSKARRFLNGNELYTGSIQYTS